MQYDSQDGADQATKTMSKPYCAPKLEFFGMIGELTLGGPGSCPDGGQSNNNNVTGNFGGQCN